MRRQLQTAHADTAKHKDFYAIYQGIRAYQDAEDGDAIECPYKEGSRRFHLFIRGLQYGQDKHESTQRTTQVSSPRPPDTASQPQE